MIFTKTGFSCYLFIDTFKMENFFEIHPGHGGRYTTYGIRDYEQPKEDGCKLEVYLLGKMILSLVGDLFRTCSNPGNFDAATVAYHRKKN
jgi:hypothetical protein